ncbi:MAG TPA: glycosyltransferase family 2 protein [Chitinophagales bacterium]|nr:glycosyltransferase family 2 protein [Chitinophagales bacterium]
MSPEGKNLPKVSVITPTWNSAKTLDKCIESVARQTYKHVEHLIVDGVSTDNTVSLAQSYQLKYKHLIVQSAPDEGIFDAMNKGIDASTGQWLIFLGGDDELADENVLLDIFEKDDTAAYQVIYGNVELKNKGTKLAVEFNSDLLGRFNIGHQAILYRREVFDILGKYNLKYPDFADYAFNILWYDDPRIKHKYVPNIISVYNELGNSSYSFDKPFYRDKLKLLLKHIKFSNPKAFTDAARYTIYDQLRGRDISGALKNLFILFRHLPPGFNKTLFLKEFAALALGRG